jgi:hypothetical protein
MDCSLLRSLAQTNELGERCSIGFEDGLAQTVRWYLDQESWWRDMTSGAYRVWLEQNYGERKLVVCLTAPSSKGVWKGVQ